MALGKNILENNGVITTYHRIEGIAFGHNKSLSCILDSYVSKEFSEDMSNKINSHSYTFENIDSYEEESFGIRELAYNKIKNLEEWQDAIDC